MRLRTTLSAALGLVLLASLLLPCFDVCAEDDGGESCPPVCASCIGCPRSPVPVPLAVLHPGTPVATGRATADSTAAVTPLFADDILHVPLAFVS